MIIPLSPSLIFQLECSFSFFPFLDLGVEQVCEGKPDPGVTDLEIVLVAYDIRIECAVAFANERMPYFVAQVENKTMALLWFQFQASSKVEP